MGEDLGFGGEIAGFYHRYRRGYPSAVIDTLTGAFGLTGEDVVIDVAAAPASSPCRSPAGCRPPPV